MPSGVYPRILPPWNKGIPRTPKEKEKMSKAHKGIADGNKNPHWKGGIVKSGGYVFIYSPNHPFKDSNNRVKRANLVMEKFLGRFLKPNDRIHHINEIKNDDRIENLMIFHNESEHSMYHNKKRKRDKFGRFIS